MPSMDEMEKMFQSKEMQSMMAGFMGAAGGGKDGVPDMEKMMEGFAKSGAADPKAGDPPEMDKMMEGFMKGWNSTEGVPPQPGQEPMDMSKLEDLGKKMFGAFMGPNDQPPPPKEDVPTLDE